MLFVSIKPLSVNECWAGKRFKAPTYKKYEIAVTLSLPRIDTLPDPPFQLELHFGVSSSAADFDNPTKPFVDILQKKYNFNDKLIHRAIIEKHIVPKGKEYIGFKITTYKKPY